MNALIPDNGVEPIKSGQKITRLRFHFVESLAGYGFCKCLIQWRTG